MKALTITQPWAQLIADGRKHVETRSWPTRHRGPLAIHAGKGTGDLGVRDLRAICEYGPYPEALGGRTYDELPKGVIVAVVNVTGCRPTSQLRPFLERGGFVDELEYGNYAPGRYGWTLQLVHKLPVPVEARGAQGLWDIREGLLLEGAGDGR